MQRLFVFSFGFFFLGLLFYKGTRNIAIALPRLSSAVRQIRMQKHESALRFQRSAFASSVGAFKFRVSALRNLSLPFPVRTFAFGFWKGAEQYRKIALQKPISDWSRNLTTSSTSTNWLLLAIPFSLFYLGPDATLAGKYGKDE